MGVGVTAEVDEELMKEIVSRPHQLNYFNVSDFERLANILDTLVQQACQTLPPPTVVSTTPRITTTPPAPGILVGNISDI